MTQPPLLTIVDGGDDQTGARRCALTEHDGCAMCGTPSARGEVIFIDGRRHEVGWCLPCWLKWMRDTVAGVA